MKKSDFKVGNKYIITETDCSLHCEPYRAKGVILTALYDDDTNRPKFKLPDDMRDIYDDDWIFCHVKYVEPYIGKHHKHHDLIIAWAKGAEIEVWVGSIGTWSGTTDPFWIVSNEYRIKPTGLEKLIQKHKAMGETIDKLTKELMND